MSYEVWGMSDEMLSKSDEGMRYELWVNMCGWAAMGVCVCVRENCR